jgi:hypothetical protein
MRAAGQYGSTALMEVAMVPFSATSILGARNSGGGKGVASRTGLSGSTPRFARKKLRCSTG